VRPSRKPARKKARRARGAKRRARQRARVSLSRAPVAASSLFPAASSWRAREPQTLSPAFRRTAELLAFHGAIASAAELTPINYKAAVMRFQEQADLLVDGVAGPNTRWAMQRQWVLAQPQLALVRCPATVLAGVDGFASLMLRADAAERYESLRKEVESAGGVITTAGGVRNLTEPANQHRSAKSMHYPGLAFDVALTSGFFKPRTDNFVVTRGATSYWNVWCRATNGEPRTLQAVSWKSWNSGVDVLTDVGGRFVDFTLLARRHGFHPIAPRQAFLRPAERHYLSAEWWHFQANDLLVPEFSQLGIELLRIAGYTETRIREANPDLWASQRATFALDWN
jgi:peptidoglycan hydrolase-like protein with peptidoglycan-binding domain